MNERLKHDGIEYIYDFAIKCEDDNYLILYDENKNEIISFYNISDWSAFEFDPGDSVYDPSSLGFCKSSLNTKTYVTGETWIPPEDFVESELHGDELFECVIPIPIVSPNKITCDVFIEFDLPTTPYFEYTAEQGEGYIKILSKSIPIGGLLINKITITRV